MLRPRADEEVVVGRLLEHGRHVPARQQDDRLRRALVHEDLRREAALREQRPTDEVLAHPREGVVEAAWGHDGLPHPDDHDDS